MKVGGGEGAEGGVTARQKERERAGREEREEREEEEEERNFRDPRPRPTRLKTSATEKIYFSRVGSKVTTDLLIN